MELYELLRGQWIFVAFGGGLVLILTAVTAYLAIWTPRPDPSSDLSEGRSPRETDSPARTFLLAMPVVLVVTFVGITIFMVVYFAAKIVSPPNW